MQGAVRAGLATTKRAREPGAGGCYFKTFLFETVCFASVLNVTALSAERYVAVVHPLKVKHVTTSAHVKRVVSALWSLSMLCSVPNASLHGITVLPPRFGRHFPRSAICRKYGTGGVVGPRFWHQGLAERVPEKRAPKSRPGSRFHS